MAEHYFYPENELIEKLENGEFDYLDYVDHFSEEWQQEYIEYCDTQGLEIGNDSAREFVSYKDEQLEKALLRGDA